MSETSDVSIAIEERMNVSDANTRKEQVSFSLQENKWIIILAFLGLYTLLHVLLYRFNPLVGDIGLLSSLSKNQNLVLEIKSPGKLVLPEGSFEGGTNPTKQGFLKQEAPPVLVYRHEGKQYALMNRDYQGGLLFTFLGKLSRWLDPLFSLIEVHLWINLLGLLLFGLFLIKISEPAIAFFALVFFVLDPVNILPYGHYFSEQFYRPILFGGMLLMMSRSKINWILAGLLFSLGVYLKVTIVLYYLVGVILFLPNLKNRRAIYLCGGVLLGMIFYLSGSNLERILIEIKSTPLDLNFPLVLQGIFHMLTQKKNFLLPLTEESFFSNLKLNNWYYFTPEIYSFLLAAFVMLPLISQLTPLKKFFSMRVYARIYLAMIVFIIAICLVARNQMSYYTFLFGISPLSSYLLARSARDFWFILKDRFHKWQKDIIFWTLLILPSFYNIVDFAFYFSKKGVVMRYDGDLASKIVEDLNAQSIKHPYTISNHSQGLYEFLSRGAVRPYYLGDLMRHEVFPSFPVMLRQLGEGTVILPIIDQASTWYWTWKHDLNPSWWVNKLREHGILVVNHFVYHSNSVPKAWRLTFKTLD